MSGLDDLFSRLDPSRPRPPSTSNLSGYQPPSVSSPLFSPPIYTPNPTNPFNVLSPVNPGSVATSPAPVMTDTTRTNNLLNLLKFNNPNTSVAQRGAAPLEDLRNIHATQAPGLPLPILKSRDVTPLQQSTTNDLLSVLQRKPSSQQTQTSQTPAGGSPQDFLLGLLTKDKGAATLSATASGPTAARASENSAQAQLPLRLAEPKPQPVADVDKDIKSEAAMPAAAVSLADSKLQTPAAQTTPSKFKFVNPFDQLHSSSPLNRNVITKPPTSIDVAESTKHDRTPSSLNSESGAPASKSRKIDADSTPAQPVDAAPSQSVAQAVEKVGEETGKQVEDALAKATQAALKTVANTRKPSKKKESAKSDVDSNWESAEDEAAQTAELAGPAVVYNFPMKPFVSLQIKPNPIVQPFPKESLMTIARLKKDFDQVDRCLATASQNHIIYAQLAHKKDNSGIRVIRQDSGDHKQVFRLTAERVFNIQVCSSPSPGHDVETVVAIGVDGTVYWTSLAKSRPDLFQNDDVEAQAFILPPISTPEENSSGSPVKTRAKVSSRHPDYFAIARGKQIYIIAPEMVKDPAYCDNTTRKVNSERFFADRTLKINTGKAGKDFSFSEDDTTIVSLDKNGRFKFWDVRELTERAVELAAPAHAPVELREPLWTLNAVTSGSKADEKPSVSSIMFLDKEKPTNKGVALRYVIIGFKQNHILQLWDLALGKAVQEIRLPHEKESDGICSISYHHKTGMIAIGHPTRNSVYLIHLSAPAYNLPSLTQAAYIGMLARGDSSLPKPETTAIMSGLRELSFEGIGQLRSVDMLKTPVPADTSADRSPTLFELYIMHSDGVIGIGITREELGWDEKGKVVSPKDAVAAGIVQASDLIVIPKGVTPAAEHSASSESVKSSKQASTKSEPQPKAIEIKKNVSNGTSNGNAAAVVINGKDTSASTQVATKAVQAPAAVAKPEIPSAPVKDEKNQAVPVPAPAPTQQPTPVIPVDLQATLDKQFDALYQRLDNDKRVQEAAAGAKQDALLRLVSSTLTENVDRSLSNIIASRIQQDVLPALTNITTAAVERKLAEDLPAEFKSTLADAFKTALPLALSEALKSRDVHQTISNITGTQVATKVQQQVTDTLQQTLPQLASKSLESTIAALETRLQEQVLQAEAQRLSDTAKIDELSTLVKTMSSTMQSMAETQTAFQEQILQMQCEHREAAVAASEAEPATPARTVIESVVEPEDTEVADLTEMLMAGKIEDATIKWIQSDYQAQVFDKLFIRVDPSYVQRLSPLTAFSVSMPITSSFENNVTERLCWLEQILASFNTKESDVASVAPHILQVISQRLQGAFLHIAEENSTDPNLRVISSLNRQVSELSRVIG